MRTTSPQAPKLEARFRRFLAELDHSEGCIPGHSMSVCRTALRMARALDVTDDELPVVALGALMHDIGKVFVEGSLLSKEAPLTEPELETIRLHPLLGEALLSPNVSDATVLGIVRWHHERWDGSGYPDGLRAGSIPLSARIVAAADAYTAMCEARAYRRPLGPHAALDELQRLSGTQFDGDCVEALVRSFAEDVSSRTEALSA